METNILIVEDHELTRFGLKTAFESNNFADKIFEAESAEKALEIVNNLSDLDAKNMIKKVVGKKGTKIIKKIMGK